MVDISQYAWKMSDVNGIFFCNHLCHKNIMTKTEHNQLKNNNLVISTFLSFALGNVFPISL